MQRRAFIIFIKTIFLGVFVAATLFPLHTRSESSSGGGGGDGGTRFPPLLGCPLSVAPVFRSEAHLLRLFFGAPGFRLSVVTNPHQNILAEPQAIWKMIHLTSGEPEFLYSCLEAIPSIHTHYTVHTLRRQDAQCGRNNRHRLGGIFHVHRCTSNAVRKLEKKKFCYIGI